MRWFDFAGASGFEGNEKSCGRLYYYGARYYDARTSVWQSVDPMAFEHTNTSPYAYVYNNPIRLIDQVGMDSTQRANALAQAQKYIDQKASGNQYLMGAKNGPGGKVDCSGLVSNVVVAGGETDPNYGDESSGVLNIENNTTPLDYKDVVPGNIVTFRKSSGYPYHTGMVSEITRDSEGNITSFSYFQSSGGVGPNVGTFDMSSTGSLSVHGFYKWDTKPDLNVADNFDRL